MRDIDETMYHLTVAQRDAAWREVEQWQKRHDDLLRVMMNQQAAQPAPRMLADHESFEAGKAMAFNSAKYTIGINTSEGVHTVVVHRNVPGQPTTLVASERLPEVKS